MQNIKSRIEAQRFIKNLTAKTKFVISKNSRALGLSRQTYQNKLDNLRKKNLITNFTINIDPNIRPDHLKYVMVEIKTNPKEPELVKELLNISQLKMLDGIIGDYSLFALFIFKSNEEYYEILNRVDDIMAKSYFKKYQIIETIKVFKTNGISLKNAKITFDIGTTLNLKQIARNSPNIEYNPQRFPGLVMKIKDPLSTVLIFSSGKIVITDFDGNLEHPRLLDNVLEEILKIGIHLRKTTINQYFYIDEIDYLILRILQEEQGLRPISTYEIKDLLNNKYLKSVKSHSTISQSTIHNRIKRLEVQGVILNYTVNFSPKKVGFEGKYFLRIKPKDPSKYNELAFKLVKNKNITDLFRIGEQLGLFAIVRVNNVEDYADFIRELYQSDDIEDTLTTFVLDELITFTNFIF
ncbi:MAG: Lrp/AsnC ligand binding domain-containing protein [Candidatus Hermodarchaeota archaeon]